MFRIGRKPDPWQLPDWNRANEDRTFGNRFDDSNGRFRVLYAGSTRLVCFLETLARFRRPPVADRIAAELTEITNAEEDHTSFGTVPASWLLKRSMGNASIEASRYAHVYSAEWLTYLRKKFVQPEGTDFDLASLLSQNRSLTQQVASEIYALGFNGIYYQSRHGADLFNWALFEPVRLKDRLKAEIQAHDIDFEQALTCLDLKCDHGL